MNVYGHSTKIERKVSDTYDWMLGCGRPVSIRKHKESRKRKANRTASGLYTCILAIDIY